MQQAVYIYHERQSSQLCARHCLNNLLQGPYFTEMDLSHIAIELDKEEQALLAKDGNNGLLEWFKNNKESQNVSMDGNFSIQVLRRALQNLGLKIYHMGSEEVKEAEQHPENETGFICNLQAHWFAIRKVSYIWYDLNSLSGLPETNAIPTTISNFFLSAKLATLKNDGYSIFIVRGNWPHLHTYDPNDTLMPYAKWYKASDLKSRAKTYDTNLLSQVHRSQAGKQNTNLGWGNQQTQNPNPNSNQNQNDMEMQYALQQSLQESNPMGSNSLNGYDPELAHALELSMKDQFKNSNNNNSNNNNNNNNNNANNNNKDEDNDIEMESEEALLQKALAMSLEQEKEDIAQQMVDEPDENEKDICFIQLVLPKNKKIQRRFKKEHKLQDIANFVKSQESFNNEISFFCPPNANYSDMDLNLETVCKELHSNKLRFVVKENKSNQAQSNESAPK